MSYIVLARKYRPQTLADVVGQEHIVQTLTNAIKEERIAQSFLFVGSRGVGKTSTARIFAKILNCSSRKKGMAVPCNTCTSCVEITNGTSLDVLEIDGASNRGIDEIRNLREQVKFKPAAGIYKVYIIDEVHMLTQEAFNALLKTLEEPPSHVKFIFATTEAHRVPTTIMSRCQRFDFRRIPTKKLAETLAAIAAKEKITIDQEALFIIGKAAEGSLRDGESILDQLASFTIDKKISKEAAEMLLGYAGESVYRSVFESLAIKDSSQSMTLLHAALAQGKDVRQFIKGSIEYVRDMIMCRTIARPETLVDRLPESIEELTTVAKLFSFEDLLYSITVLQNAATQLKTSAAPQITAEIALLKIAQRDTIVAVSDLLTTVAQLQDAPEQKSDAPACPPENEKRITSQAEAYLKKAYAPTPPTPIVKAAPAASSEETVEVKGSLSSPSSEGKGLSFRLIEEGWNVVLHEVKKKKMSTGIFLSEAEPMDIEGTTVVVGLPTEFKFHKETLDSTDNKAIVEGVLSACFQQPLKVRFVVMEKDGEEASVAEKKEAEAQTSKIINSALDIFQGKVLRKQ